MPWVPASVSRWDACTAQSNKSWALSMRTRGFSLRLCWGKLPAQGCGFVQWWRWKIRPALMVLAVWQGGRYKPVSNLANKKGLDYGLCLEGNEQISKTSMPAKGWPGKTSEESFEDEPALQSPGESFLVEVVVHERGPGTSRPQWLGHNRQKRGWYEIRQKRWTGSRSWKAYEDPEF